MAKLRVRVPMAPFRCRKATSEVLIYNMQINIDAGKALGTICVSAIIAVFVWMWTINERVAKIESPDSMISRVETLEKLIFPIGVEYEVRKRMEKLIDREQPTSGISGVLPRLNESMDPRFEATPNQPVNPKFREDAEDNVRSMLEQRPLEEVKKRRGKPIEFKKKTKD